MRLLALICSIFILSCTPAPKPVPVETNFVQMTSVRFEPRIIRVKVGTTVQWKNSSSTPHNVVGEDFRSPFLYENERWEMTFDKAGTFDYYCEPHRGMGMIGTVIVE